MKCSSGPRNTVSNLPETVHQQLNMYALAASAAGVGMLALAQPSEAKIVYTPANVHIGINRRYNLDLNHDRTIDFTIENVFAGNGKCTTFAEIGEKANGVNGVIIARGFGGFFATALSQGAKIGASQVFRGNSRFLAIYNHYKTTTSNVCMKDSFGRWINVTNHYLGLKFVIHGKTHYGWAQLTVNKSGHSFTARLTGYAYENIAGKAIIAGQTNANAYYPTNKDSGPAASVASPTPDTPQPASLGMLALGAQAVPLWRRKESLDATPE
jgi:hypothetical protein